MDRPSPPPLLKVATAKSRLGFYEDDIETIIDSKPLEAINRLAEDLREILGQNGNNRRSRSGDRLDFKSHIFVPQPHDPRHKVGVRRYFRERERLWETASRDFDIKGRRSWWERCSPRP